MTGKWPQNQIDHIDLNRGNNKWENLREATNSQNQSNKRAKISNSSGYKGVHYSKQNNRFIAEIQSNNRKIYIGCYKTAKEAHKAYCEAAEKYHGEFARTC